jgi:hypothetical protein
MTVRVFNHSPFLVFTQRGKPIASQTWADVEKIDIQKLADKNLVRIVADMDESLVPIISPQEAAVLVANGIDVESADNAEVEEPEEVEEVEEPEEVEDEVTVVPQPAFSQKDGGSSTIKPKRARTKRPPAAKE